MKWNNLSLHKIKWICSFIVVLLPFFCSISNIFQKYLAVTLWAIMMWMFELLPEEIVAIMLPGLYILFDITNYATAFSAWTTSTPWITLGGLMIGGMIVKSGLVLRIAYKSLLLTKGSLKGIVWGIVLTCTIFTPLIPSIMAKVALLVPVVIGICKVLKVEAKSATASALMLVVFFALWSPKMAFMTASTDSILTAGILEQYLGVKITWLAWAKDMFIPGVLWMLVSIPLIYILRPQHLNLNKEYLEIEYRKLGKITIDEKKTVTLITALLILLIFSSWHKLPEGVLMLGIGCLGFFPGIGLLKSDDFSKIQFKVVFFLAGAVTIEAVASSIGITESVINFVQPYFEQMNSYELVMSIYIFSILANFLLNPLALIATLMIPIANLCSNLGYSATIGGYSMIMGFNQALFPYEIAPLMLVYGFGYLKLTYLIKVMVFRIVAGIIFMTVVTYPYWLYIGLLDK
jgi:anion transporter